MTLTEFEGSSEIYDFVENDQDKTTTATMRAIVVNPLVELGEISNPEKIINGINFIKLAQGKKVLLTQIISPSQESIESAIANYQITEAIHARKRQKDRKYTRISSNVAKEILPERLIPELDKDGKITAYRPYMNNPTSFVLIATWDKERCSIWVAPSKKLVTTWKPYESELTRIRLEEQTPMLINEMTTEIQLLREEAQRRPIPIKLKPENIIHLLADRDKEINSLVEFLAPNQKLEIFCNAVLKLENLPHDVAYIIRDHLDELKSQKYYRTWTPITVKGDKEIYKIDFFPDLRVEIKRAQP